MEQFGDVIKYADQAWSCFQTRECSLFPWIRQSAEASIPEAIGSLEQAKRLAQSDSKFMSDISNMLGDAYNATKAYDKSDKAYDEALVFNPENFTALNNYSYYLAIRKSNLEKAEKMSALLAKHNPDNPTFLDTYAWVLYTREKFKEARKVIERAISTGNANAHISSIMVIFFLSWEM